jgi:hypothetical protein
MSNIIERHIKGTHEMQMDLVKDGELPSPFSDILYHSELMEHGCEEPAELARLVCEGAAKEVGEYAETSKLHRGVSETKGDYERVRIYSYNGSLCAELCYSSNCAQSQSLVLQAISKRYPTCIWL